jgi:glutamine synthetase
VGTPGDPATRIENRVGEPAANPYLYMAAQIHAGLDGLARGLTPPPGSDAPYAEGGEQLPSLLGDALTALRDDAELSAGLGHGFVPYFCQVKQSEIDRHAQAENPQDFERCEYFSRT